MQQCLIYTFKPGTPPPLPASCLFVGFFPLVCGFPSSCLWVSFLLFNQIGVIWKCYACACSTAKHFSPQTAHTCVPACSSCRCLTISTLHMCRLIVRAGTVKYAQRAAGDGIVRSACRTWATGKLAAGACGFPSSCALICRAQMPLYVLPYLSYITGLI